MQHWWSSRTTTNQIERGISLTFKRSVMWDSQLFCIMSLGAPDKRLSADILEELCRVPGVIGLKEATGDVTLGLELCNRLADTDVSLSGDDFTFATLMTHGFHGVISVLSNPAPAQTVAWADAASNGSADALARLFQLLPVVDFLFHQSNPLPCKSLMMQMGLLASHARLPLLALQEGAYTLPNQWEKLQ